MTCAFRRALAALATIGVLLLTATACSDDSPVEQTPAAASAPGTASERPPASASASPSASRSTPMDIRVTIDGRPVDATLNDSPAARDLASLFPLTLDLEDFHGTERIADPPRKLTTEGAPEPAAAKVGDIAYFAPWGNLAIFYENGPSASSDLLILGHIDADADQLAGADRITIEAAS
ncbi:cyclophilin-like fold protein [Streptomyces sp. NPDC048438]|uniref:cyclophilin-like fold protein n=1 Tax=Streptomyces sp. NPDC048438 TaxID=3365551 RepID=UPI0037176915